MPSYYLKIMCCSVAIRKPFGLMRPFVVTTALLVTGSLAGCKPADQVAVSYEPNYVYARAMAVRAEADTEGFLNDTDGLIGRWFGTPDEPKLPPLFENDDDYKNLISLENLQMAAGPAPDSLEPGERGLFRQQCVSCHGVTGQGRGTVAASQNPYPRDFRKGVFKYKSTTRNGKPTKDDLRRTLVHGLDGSQMPKFDKLTDKQLDALIDYVVYLSIRGELERQLVTTAAFDLDEGERLYDPSMADSADEEVRETYTDQLDEAESELIDIADTWIEAEDDIVEVEEPEDAIVAGLTDEPIDADALAASIERGKVVFGSQIAACAKCHGASGAGDGLQLPDYDDWTKEWTTQINIDPKSHEEILPFLVDGALPPQPLAPRNLVEGRLRGGREPDAIYRRILLGIAGAPMPAAAVSEDESKGLTQAQIWDLVNYVLSLKQPEAS